MVCVCIGWQENSPFESSIVCFSDCVLFSKNGFVPICSIRNGWLCLIQIISFESNSYQWKKLVQLPKHDRCMAIKLVSGNSCNFHKGDKVRKSDNLAMIVLVK